MNLESITEDDYRHGFLRKNTLLASSSVMRCGFMIRICGHNTKRWCAKCKKCLACCRGHGQDNLFQMPLGFAGPMVRPENPDTSHEAAEAMTPERLSQIQADVLDWFRIVRRATDEELEVHFRDKYPAQTTVSKRRTDLVRLGYLRDSGERHYNSNMRRMIVWELIVRKKA